MDREVPVAPRFRYVRYLSPRPLRRFRERETGQSLEDLAQEKLNPLAHAINLPATLTGQWDDASNTLFLPIFGAVLTDPAFNIVGSFTRVGFRGVPLPGSPFDSLPAGIHVQFRLDEVPPGSRGADFASRWADNLANFGRMVCTVTP